MEEDFDRYGGLSGLPAHEFNILRQWPFCKQCNIDNESNHWLHQTVTCPWQNALLSI